MRACENKAYFKFYAASYDIRCRILMLALFLFDFSYDWGLRAPPVSVTLRRDTFLGVRLE